jgi:ABC-2 type transport system permease protein
MKKRLLALIRKEAIQIIRDPSSILIAFIFPLLLLFIYGYGVSLDMDHLKIGIALEDRRPPAEDFAFSLQHSTYFDPVISMNQKELSHKVMTGELDGFVVIPFYFSYYKALDPDQKGPFYVVADGSAPNTASFVENYVRGAFGNWIEQQRAMQGRVTTGQVVVSPRYWYNEELNSRYFLLPGSIGIIMALIGTLLTALVVAREWERGTVEALMATPVTMGEIITSKMICYLVLGLGSMTICTLITIFFYGVPFRGSFLALLAVSAVFLLAALETGLLISFATRSQFLASQVAIVSAFLPAFILSGFIFEISSMPDIIQAVAHMLPAKYLVSSLQTLFLVGDVWALLLTNMAVMGLIAVILLLMIARRAKKRLD